MRGHRISESGSYHYFSNVNSSTAILLRNYISVAGYSSFNTIGNSVVVSNDDDYLALFSVSLPYRRQVDIFKDIYLNYALPENYRQITAYVIGGNFPSKRISDGFAEELNLFDVAKEIDMVSEQVRDDSCRLLIFSGLESIRSYRQLGLVKEKILTHSPISSIIKN